MLKVIELLNKREAELFRAKKISEMKHNEQFMINGERFVKVYDSECVYIDDNWVTVTRACIGWYEPEGWGNEQRGAFEEQVRNDPARDPLNWLTNDSVVTTVWPKYLDEFKLGMRYGKTL